MIFILRRVAIASSLVLAALLLWFRRVDPPKVTRMTTATTPVVVAARDIPEGFPLDRAAIAVARWPVGSQPEGAYTTVEAVGERVTRGRVFKGEAIVPGRLAPARSRAGLEVRITPGKRAYSVRVDDAATLAGMIQRNSWVDIMLIAEDPKRKGRRTAELVMSNMRVLGIGSSAQRTEDGRPSTAAVATIEVTPDEAEDLAVAASYGAIQLVLRGYGDHEGPNGERGAPDTIAVEHERSPAVIWRGGFDCRPDSGLVRDLLLRSCGSETRFSVDSAGQSNRPR